MMRQAIDLLRVTLIMLGGGLLDCQSQVPQLHAGGGSPVVDLLANCQPGADWLPVTAPPTLAMLRAHPATECGFYEIGFQYFLLVTQPGANGDPAFVAYPTIDDIFTRAQPLAAGALAPVGTHRGTSSRAWLGDVKQPGGREIAIDQDGHSIYYGTHVNQAFVDFVNGNGLQTALGIQNADPNLHFPSGVVALRSAWRDIDNGDGIMDNGAFISTTAWVSRLQQDVTTGAISEDKDHPRQIRVALLALHVAFALPGHPELIWTTFEHVDATRISDVAPVAPGDLNPDHLSLNLYDLTVPASSHGTILYAGGTPMNRANHPPASESLLAFDESTQSFGVRTSVYRSFPASRSHTTHIKPEVSSLNANLQSWFLTQAGTLDRADRRGAYALVGGMWMDRPDYFTVDSALQNDAQSPFVTGSHLDRYGLLQAAIPLDVFALDLQSSGTASAYSILGGDDRLSGTATESFTQAIDQYDNCMTCHNTQTTTAAGVPLPRNPGGAALITAKLINVSRVFSKFVLEECGAGGVCPPP